MGWAGSTSGRTNLRDNSVVLQEVILDVLGVLGELDRRRADKPAHRRGKPGEDVGGGALVVVGGEDRANLLRLLQHHTKRLERERALPDGGGLGDEGLDEH